VAKSRRGGYWSETLGALLLIAGLGLLLWQIMVAGGLTTIPFNNYTYAAFGIAVIGAAAFGVGADRDFPKGG
jgi:hypothetical protein